MFGAGRFGPAQPVEAAALSCPPPRPGVVCFQINMQGTDVVPPVATSAWGFVRFYNFNDTKTAADYTVDVKGLSGTLISGADINRAPMGSNGPVIHHLADGGFIVTSGHMTFTPSDLNDIAAGNWYVNLTTTENPDGELRGQVSLPDGFWTPTNLAPIIVPPPSGPPPFSPPQYFGQDSSFSFISPAQPMQPPPQFFAPPVQYGVANEVLPQPTATCYGDLSSVTFQWAPIPGGMVQWVDVSYVDDVFTPGTFYGYGPLFATDHQLTWDNIEVEIPFNWRVNTLTPFGWISSAAGSYNPC